MKLLLLSLRATKKIVKRSKKRNNKRKLRLNKLIH
jgi:hypothetical protein